MDWVRQHRSDVASILAAKFQSGAIDRRVFLQGLAALGLATASGLGRRFGEDHRVFPAEDLKKLRPHHAVDGLLPPQSSRRVETRPF